MAVAAQTAPKMSTVQANNQGVIAPVASDLATAITLVNQLRQIVLNQGVVTAA
jgi:uncharacterized protein YaaN involved in tellurite resistance